MNAMINNPWPTNPLKLFMRPTENFGNFFPNMIKTNTSKSVKKNYKFCRLLKKIVRPTKYYSKKKICRHGFKLSLLIYQRKLYTIILFN